ncbi:MAG: SET domain-containing protein-lysine N-methyltransferase [Bacteroidetes bacterium]|nr:SET domain-containing protein-lysine N-methyltransferase [Bacteroidota bacterium]
MISSLLFIAESSNRGRGVFAAEDIGPNTTIESSPVIVMSREDRILLDQTLLHDYIFEWGNRKNQCCVALGYISIYNHSYHSNCEYEMDFDEDLIRIKTVRPVMRGEELSINYNGDWNDQKPVWFDVT